MTFPIRPVPPVGGVPLVREQENPELAAAAMAENPGKATSMLSGLLRIDNVDGQQAFGRSNGSTLAPEEQIRRFVKGVDPSHPPTQASFASVLLSVTLLEEKVRRELGETVGQTSAPPAQCEAKREVLQEALRRIVEVKRFHGPR